MKKHYVIVEHRNSDAFNRQKARISSLEAELSLLRKRYSELETLYCSEIYYNNALCDLLRSHNIPFRSVFSSEYRSSRR